MTAPVTSVPRILIVDDEQSIRMALSGVLNADYDTTTADSGEKALELAASEPFDLILLDILLPGIDGLEVLEALHEQAPDTIVIMLTAHGTIESAVSAMRHGALNYLRKPASNDKILESVKEGLKHAAEARHRKAVLLKAKRLLSTGLQELAEVMPEGVEAESYPEETPAPAGTAGASATADPDRYLHCGPLTVDLYRRIAELKGAELDLTAGEYDLLLCLVQAAPKVLDPQELVRRTRGFECELQEARELIRWQVYLLRQKIEDDSSDPQYILNVRGRGYMWAGV
jgi:DNA-binding response OmpR family regulator